MATVIHSVEMCPIFWLFFPSVAEFSLPGVLWVVFMSTEGAHENQVLSAQMTIIMVTNVYRETFSVINIIIWINPKVNQ